MTCRKVGGEQGIDFLKITLTDVLISTVQNGGSSSGDTPQETIQLHFSEYKVEYQEQDNKGAKKGGPIISGFSVQKNAKTA